MIDVLNSAPWWVMLVLGCVVGFLIGVFCLDFMKHDGVIHVFKEEDKDRYLFEFNIPPEDIPKMKIISFGVKLEKEDGSKNLQSS